MSPLASSDTSSRIRLALSNRENELGEVTDWAGPLVALGHLARRYVQNLERRQLVIAISVPRRELAAVLIGVGWVLGYRSTTVLPVRDVLKTVKNGTPIRLVTDRYVIADYFQGVDSKRSPECVQLSGNSWIVDKVEAVCTLSELDEPVRSERLDIGSVGQWAGLDRHWAAHLASPECDLAIVGTLKWIKRDVEIFVSLIDRSTSDETHPRSSSIASLLIPGDQHSATSSTYLFSSSRIADELPLPDEVQATVLDGSGAIKYLDAIESKLVICVLDRSVADEAADEMLIQRRNTRSELVSLKQDLGWRPEPGMEALAFTVAL